MKALAISMLVLGTVAVAQAEGLRAAIEASNKKIHVAMKKKDFAALDRAFRAGMTKDFKYVENGQTQTYDQMFQNMKMGLSQMTKLTKVGTKILTVKENGKTGVCTSEHMMAGTMVGPDKKTHTSEFSGVAIETYVKVGSTWKLSKMEWKSTKMMMDGKPMGAAGGGG